MLGALLVAAAFLVTTGSLSPDDRVRLAGILAAAVIVGLLGLAGDRRTISSNVEFSLLLIPSAVIVLLGIEVRFIPLKLVSIPLTLFYLLGGSAAVNLLDGMDGLAAGVTAIASAFFAALFLGEGHSLGTFLAVALLGASLGFLYHNFHRATIFMGDGGSLFLGFTLSTLAILSTSRPYDLAGFVAPILIIGVPVADTFLAVARRVRNRRHVITGDRRHLYDLIRMRGIGDIPTVLVMYGLSLVLGASGLLAVRIGALSALALSLSEALVLLLIAIRLGAFYLET